MGKTPLSKEELIEQLKEISKRDNPHDIEYGVPGAMCYSPAPMELETKCDTCGRWAVESGYFLKNPEEIKDVVEQIKALGYDTKVEFLCPDCAAKAGIIKGTPSEDNHRKPFSFLSRILKTYDRIYSVFYFKAKDQEEYHVAVSDEISDYKAVLAFLKDEPTYTGHFDRINQTKDSLDIIKRLTGISVE